MQALVSWIVGHQGVLAGAGVAVLDLVFALSPKIDSNGILHWVYLQLLKLKGDGPKPQ